MRLVVELTQRLLASLVAQPQRKPDLLLRLQDIRCLTSVLAGRADVLTRPEVSYEIDENAPGSSLTIVAGCGHMAPLERPGHVAHLLNGLCGTA